MISPDSGHKKNRKFYLQIHFVQSCKLYNNEYMIAPTQITNTEIFAFIAVVVFTFLSRNVVYKQKRQ